MSDGSRRARAKLYECLYCKRRGKLYREVRYRLAAHIYKHHKALDQAPFYCTMCLLRCSSRAALLNHVTRYSRHQVMAKDMGSTDNARYLIENPTPSELQLGVDYLEVPASEASPLPCHPISEDVQAGEWDTDVHTGQEVLTASPVPGATNLAAMGSLVNVQVTPEMLASLLALQSGKNKGLQVATATGLPSNVPTQSSSPLYMPSPSFDSSHPIYTPTPITSKVVSSVSASTTLATPTRVMPGFTSMPSKTPPLRAVAPPAFSSPPPENILPQLLGTKDNRTDYDLGFGEEWLEDPVLAPQPPSLLEVVCTETSSGTTAVLTEPLSAEPASKRARKENTQEPETSMKDRQEMITTGKLDKDAGEEPETSTHVQDSITTKIEAIVDRSVKSIVEALERNSRAVRCFDKTMTEFKDVMVRMGRSVERMGEDQRREFERRREAARSERKQDRSSDAKAVEDTRSRKFKENQPLKSVVNKK